MKLFIVIVLIGLSACSSSKPFVAKGCVPAGNDLFVCEKP